MHALALFCRTVVTVARTSRSWAVLHHISPPGSSKSCGRTCAVALEVARGDEAAPPTEECDRLAKVRLVTFGVAACAPESIAQMLPADAGALGTGFDKQC
eukprot:1924871-Pyramimonas_sp.AAC.2